MNGVRIKVRTVDVADIRKGTVVVPAVPGVYSWYRRVTLDYTNPESFVQSIAKALEKSGLPIHEGKVGPYHATLSPKGRSFPEAKRQVAERVAPDLDSRRRFASLMAELSPLLTPLYIGMATDLRVRINNHIEGSDFVDWLEESGGSLNELVVTYAAMYGFPPRTEELMEYILSVVSAPPYVRRRG